ncbi:MAG: DNA-binding response regulator, partial [Verrucomicrobia bacterium]
MRSKSNGQILIVDDDGASRRLLVRTLSTAGYRCKECASGVEALSLIRREQPSLLLLDFAMPDLDGAEVLKQLRA